MPESGKFCEISFQKMNPKIKNIDLTILSNNWYTLRKVTFDYQKKNGAWETQNREAYDRGNGAVILLFNKTEKTVILTRQFRMPTYLNGNESGMLIEACAGLLDADSPEMAIKREVEEELGFRIDHVQKIFQAYMSPGSVTEIVHFFVAEFDKNQRIHDGGGIEDEEIEVLELDFQHALNLIQTGEIMDGKTIMLLQYAQIHGFFL
jgi:GDP-mannose pyrophosphatase NudK